MLLSKTASTGSDALGEYETHILSWATKGSPYEAVMETLFKTYIGDTGIILFEQHFPVDVKLNVSNDGLAAATLFPAFRRGQGPQDGLDCFSYHGVFPTMKGCKVQDYKESHQGGAPLAIYNASDARLPMLVLAPLAWPKAQHMASTKTVFGVGVKSTVEEIPAGWKQSVMLSAGSGIQDGMMAWGDRVLKYLGKPRADAYADDVVGTIGFWTDNGGYYHYDTGTNETYEEVLPKVKAYHDSIGVPFRHWQFDSWFYPKDAKVDPGGGGGGVTNWTASPSIFPHGMAYIQSKLNLPIIMHNRQWSTKSDYIHNLSFEWYISEKAAVPKDPAAFFEWFFKQQEGWGLAMYEQDWMCTEYDEVTALHTNISLADLWLRGMAVGAASSGRTVQYCMPYAYDLLSGAAHPAVTNARATGDYFHGKDQWALGGASLFYWAIGILPFKDGFYSSNLPQVGGQTVGPETNPDRETLMATLSCAMVGPMDGIHLLNKSRVMTSCRGDGFILKPDRPVVTAETCFTGRGDPGQCYVYHAFSDVEGLGRVHYHFNNDGPQPLVPGMVRLPENEKGYAVYNWYSGRLSMLAESNRLDPGYEGHVYAVVAPVAGGWTFLGEVDKYVTAARLRFPLVRPSSGRLEVFVTGVKDEVVSVCAAEASSMLKVCKPVHFDSAGTQSVLFAPGGAIVV